MTEDENRELMQLRSTESHIIDLVKDEKDQQTRDILMAKYRRTQARRREIEEIKPS